jgi:hypothetical protein
VLVFPRKNQLHRWRLLSNTALPAQLVRLLLKIWLGQREKTAAIAGRASHYMRGFADEKHQHSNP